MNSQEDEIITVVGHGVLGLFVTVILAMNGYKVRHLRANIPVACLKNQGWLHSGLAGLLKKGVDAEIVGATLASHHEILALSGRIAKYTGLAILPSSAWSVLNRNASGNPRPFNLMSAPDEMSPFFVVNDDVATGQCVLQSFDCPFPDQPGLLTILDSYIQQSTNVTIDLCNPFAPADVAAFGRDGKKVLLCCGANTPKLIGADLCKGLSAIRTKLLATADHTGLKADFMMHVPDNFVVVRHRRPSGTYLIWARNFGLDVHLDNLDLPIERDGLERYNQACEKFETMVKSKIGPQAKIEGQECTRLEYDSPISPWVKQVSASVFAGIAGKASNGFSAACRLIDAAGIMLPVGTSVASQFDEIRAQYYRNAIPRVDPYKYWFDGMDLA
jgi:hypothetical protein